MVSFNLILALCAPTLALATPLSKNCKAFPGSSAWPSSNEWSRLNKTIDGRLIRPNPPGGVCHNGQPNYNKDQCPNVQQDWRTFEFHAQDPVSVMWDLWANYTCLPFEDFPCSGAGYPSYVAEVATAKHVKAAVDFARKRNVRLVVRSSGHDYLGRSVGSGALSIWTHHLNKIQYHKGQFKLSGSGKTIRGDAITAGAGTAMLDLYNVAAQNGRTVVGGGAKTVGLGGYVTGGGHSILAPHYGLAADNVLEMEVVTPNGDIITVNEDRHSDLFWAIRGGGGSTFGVLTSVTVMTHPSKKLTMVSFMAFTLPQAPFALDLVTWATSQIPYLSDSGLSGYLMATVDSPPPVPIPGLPEKVAGLMGKTIILDTQDTTKINKIFKPLNETIQKRWPGQVTLLVLTQPYDSFAAWYSENFDDGQAGGSVYLISRLLDKDTLTKDLDALADALKPILINDGWLGTYMVAGKGVNKAKPRGGGNAVHPAWRKAYIHAIHWLGWGYPPFDETAEGRTRKILNDRFQALRELTPGGGSYMNEGFPFEEDWQHTFWGDNYERLLKIKRKVDPKDVLWCTPCVGSEGWEEKSDGRLCRV
ncbi:FAD-binding PCMH-type domain-containing protein [Fusarium falciforme]|uniref:FAD-binding PCMH-type domain-containing protein n=1 Tax=Fusarium falciforme TaxID=195108 RepID=UPI002301AEA9|nr:FAD-binding PCMH-type domain-containing protein [Fusarium falciforme]WAO87413.1 FAD-binding PCMH-type domain-containing protein [Fusarium falciforme]